jgi:hypothetical protein
MFIYITTINENVCRPVSSMVSSAREGESETRYRNGSVSAKLSKIRPELNPAYPWLTLHAGQAGRQSPV